MLTLFTNVPAAVEGHSEVIKAGSWRQNYSADVHDSFNGHILWLCVVWRAGGCFVALPVCVCVCVSLFLSATVTCIPAPVINPHTALT